MSETPLEQCPGCGGMLPHQVGPTHRYIGASPACWALFSALLNGGEPPIDPAPLSALIGDAYAAQHPGTPSDQATQSVAVHLLTLYGVLERGVASNNALWIRRRALRVHDQQKHGRYRWLNPPQSRGLITIAAIVDAQTPSEGSALVRPYVEGVWSAWASIHGVILADWYDCYVVHD